MPDAPRLCIFPAIDLRAGRCVRLFQGDYAQETVFDDDPVGVALRWRDEGAEWLHVVDLDAARAPVGEAGRGENLRVVARIAAAVEIPVQMGGGVRDRESARRVLEAGVRRAIIGTAAAGEFEAAAALFGEFGESLVLGVDARDGRVAVAGWQQSTALDAVELTVRLATAGARRVIFTDIATDGTGRGPSIEATRRLALAAGIPVIASGGIGSPTDVAAVRALVTEGVEGLIIGQALYTGAVKLPEAIALAGGRPC